MLGVTNYIKDYRGLSIPGMGRVRELAGHRKRCPDCWYPLLREGGRRSGPLGCPNPDCLVIHVTYAKGGHRIVRVTRAAVAR